MHHHQHHHQQPSFSSPMYHHVGHGSGSGGQPGPAGHHHPPHPNVHHGAQHMMASVPSQGHHPYHYPPHSAYHSQAGPASSYAYGPPGAGASAPPLHSHHHHQQRSSSFSYSPPTQADQLSSPGNSRASAGAANASSSNKTVVRAACLSCRSAKRRCDGQQPVCGPCNARGVTEDSGQCQYVASKRGGPRFKGHTGEEAKRIKAEKDRQKQLEQEQAFGGQRMSVSPEASPTRSMSGNGRQWHQPSSIATPSAYDNYGNGHVTRSNSSSASRSEVSASLDEINMNGARAYPGVSSSSNSATSYSFTSPEHSANELDMASSSKMRMRTQPFAYNGMPDMTSTQQQQQHHHHHHHHHHQQQQQHHSMLQQSLPPPARTPLAPPTSHTPGSYFFPTATPSNQFAVAPPPTMPSVPPEVQAQAQLRATPSNALSSANLEMWQKLQEDAAALGLTADLSDISHFYSKLETLPKAGTAAIDNHAHDERDVSANGGGGTHDSSIGGGTGTGTGTGADGGGDDIEMFCQGLTFDPDLEPHLLDAADSEQQARFLLTAFFDKVYPSAPVLVAPENLSSLAFWFSGKGPCALYAAISALVALRLPEEEAHRTLRGGYQRSPDEGARPGLTTRAEIAAHHARTSDFLLRRFSQQQAAAAAASFGLDPQALSTGCDPDETGRALCQGPSDPELLRIEAAAAHTLLSHYFYGVGGKGSHKASHDHALEAWNSLQGIRIELQEGVPPKDLLTTSHFSWEQKQEWAKRVFWTSFAAAACTAATGGYAPIQYSLDAVAALQLRPALESDVGAWGVFIRGAQHVARGYTTLWEFDRLLTAERDPQQALAKANDDPQRASLLTEEDRRREKMRIFADFSKLDRDMTAFCTYDPAWRQSFTPESPSTPSGGMEGARNNPLGFALRTAGKLMTAGSTIIIHRGQAYANANIFMSSQCGLMRAGGARGRCGPVVGGEDGAESAGIGLQAPGDGHHAGKVAGVGACSVMPPDAGNGDGSGDMDDEPPGSPSDLYVPPDRLWHRSGSTSLPPAGSGSGSMSAGPPHHHHHGSASVDPSVAALDATFIGWGAQPHTAPTPPSAAGTPTTGPHPGGYYDGSATNTAMAAFQQFQAQQQQQQAQQNQRKKGSISSSIGAGPAPSDEGTARRTSASSSQQQAHPLSPFGGGSGSMSLPSGPSSISYNAPPGSTPPAQPDVIGKDKDRYKHGPFEPEASARKCRWAANSMLECVAAMLAPDATSSAPSTGSSSVAPGATHDIMGTPFSESPTLPPWAACTYVLGGYCLLMQCLITQASQAWKSAHRPVEGNSAGDGGDADKAARERAAKEELQGLRGHVVAIHRLLERFALTFEVVHEYKRELGVLLEINKRIA